MGRAYRRSFRGDLGSGVGGGVRILEIGADWVMGLVGWLKEGVLVVREVVL